MLSFTQASNGQENSFYDSVWFVSVDHISKELASSQSHRQFYFGLDKSWLNSPQTPLHVLEDFLLFSNKWNSEKKNLFTYGEIIWFWTILSIDEQNHKCKLSLKATQGSFQNSSVGSEAPVNALNPDFLFTQVCVADISLQAKNVLSQK